MFTNLLIVVAVGLFAPLALGFFPRIRLPAIVLEIVLGIVIGPSGLGWVKPAAPVMILSLVGLAFLLFLSGLEIDVGRLRRRIVKLTALGFAVSFAIAILIGAALHVGGFVKSPLFVAIVLVATSLGVIGVAVASAERSISLSRVLRRLQDTTAQIRVRAAFLLLIGFTALAESAGVETILGAFAAGALLSLLDRDETIHPQFRLKLEAVGFGVFIPIFFVTSGPAFNLHALFANSSTVARVPLFLLAILLARGLPALTYVRTLGLSRSLIAGILQATSLPFIVAATQIGLQLGIISPASAAGLVAAGLLSLVISPALGLVLLRRQRPAIATLSALPTPVMPVLTAEDRVLCRASESSSELQGSTR